VSLAPPRTPALLAISHGTSSPTGQSAVSALVAAVADARPALRLRDGFVDVQQPDVPTVLDGLDPDEPAVVVPLLLSAGYHVHVDLRREVSEAARPAVCAAALGPDPRLVDVLVRRLAEAGCREDDAVVLVAAGSSDARAVDDCRATTAMLAVRIGRPVDLGFVSAAVPRAADAVAAARLAHPGRRVVAANYTLAPGFFAGMVAQAGADVTTAPLLARQEPPPRELVDLVLDRYDEAIAAV
jgi:sirohydrochlorin ferrochelatase